MYECIYMHMYINVCICVYIEGFRLTQVCRVQNRELVFCCQNKRSHWALLLSFFHFYGPLQSCFHYLNNKASTWLSTRSRNDFFKKSPCLQLVSVFEAILVTKPFMTWILKEQFSNLAPWNMSDLSFFTSRLWLRSFWWIFTKDVKELELALVVWTFNEGLSVNDILCWWWSEGDLYESRILKFG